MDCEANAQRSTAPGKPSDTQGAKAHWVLSSPSSGMRCHPRSVAPEGGVPAYGTLTAAPGKLDALQHHLTGSGAHPVQGTLLLLPVGRMYHGRGKPSVRWQGARCSNERCCAPTGNIGKATGLLAEAPKSPPQHCPDNSMACGGLHWSAYHRPRWGVNACGWLYLRVHRSCCAFRPQLHFLY